VAQVGVHQQDFESLGTRVLTISFGTPYWAQVWLEETQSPFPLLLDSKRTAYRAYGLDYSLLRSWGWQTIAYYTRALFNGEEWRGIRGDSGQMGGDFIVDAQGMVRLAYPSRNPTDRPPVEVLLSP